MRRTVAAPLRLGELLEALVPGSSGRTRKQMLADGRVSVNGAVVDRAAVELAPGDVVEVGPRGARRPASAGAIPGRPAPARGPLAVTLEPGLHLLHEDADVLVVDKGPGLLTIATATEKERTVWAALARHVRRRDAQARVFIVHRLDREASGLLVLARTPEAKAALQEQFRAHSVERLYAALVEGRIETPAGVIEAPLVEDEVSGTVRVARPGEGKEARTHWRLLESDARHALLEVRLETGRKHQIRVHLAHLGHPVAGDVRYGSRHKGLGRLALHASTLGFLHPRTGELLRFESEVPKSFRRAAREARREG